MSDAALVPLKRPIRPADEDDNPCGPVRIIAADGKPGPGIVRVPEIPAPETQVHRISYGAHVRAEAHYASPTAKILEAAKRGGRKKWTR